VEEFKRPEKEGLHRRGRRGAAELAELRRRTRRVFTKEGTKKSLRGEKKKVCGVGS